MNPRDRALNKNVTPSEALYMKLSVIDTETTLMDEVMSIWDSHC